MTLFEQILNFHVENCRKLMVKGAAFIIQKPKQSNSIEMEFSISIELDQRLLF